MIGNDRKQSETKATNMAYGQKNEMKKVTQKETTTSNYDSTPMQSRLRQELRTLKIFCRLFLYRTKIRTNL
jgi:hypothetical protein